MSLPLLAACGPSERTLSLTNDGTSSMEGHTPTGFAGTGTGLFAADDINGGFPEGEVTQVYLSFRLLDTDGRPLTGGGWTASEATLTGESCEVVGDPFEALGALSIERVAFDGFGPELFDQPPADDPPWREVYASDPDEDFVHDVTGALQLALDEGRDWLQFRLRWEEPSDDDDVFDGVRFTFGDGNVNEPGIFTLQAGASRGGQ